MRHPRPSRHNAASSATMLTSLWRVWFLGLLSLHHQFQLPAHIVLVDARFLQQLATTQQDPLAAAFDSVYRTATGASYCTCECCQSKQTDTCQRPTHLNLGAIGYQCGFNKPFSSRSSDEDGLSSSGGADSSSSSGGEDKSYCQERCLPPLAGNEENTAQQEMNHARFCELQCKVTAAKAGGSCEMNTQEELANVLPTEAKEGGSPCLTVVWSDEGTGLGAFLKKVPPVGVKDEAGGGSGTDSDAATELAGEEAAEKEGEEKKKYEVDLRGLFGRTKMSEAASQVAATKADAARSAYASQRSESALAQVEAAQQSLLRTANVGPESIGAASNLLTAAKEEFSAAKKDLQEARVLSKQVAGQAAAGAVGKIKAAVTPAAKKIGELKAEAYGWNQPDFWPRVIAARAAEPYQQQMVLATQRTAEYDREARRLIGEATKKQEEAGALAEQLKVLEDELAAGADRMTAEGATKSITAAELQHKIRVLVGEAKQLEGAAQGAYATAQASRQQITSYQDAAFAAAEVVSGNYTATFSQEGAGV